MKHSYLFNSLLCLLIILIMLAIALVNADRIDDIKPAAPVAKVTTQKTEPFLTIQATAFCSYGWDANGIDYGPGYVIISSESEIPLYSLLEIDQYGEAQAIGVSDQLAPDEIKVWYNAPSKVDMFGRQEVKVKIKGKGDKPCAIP